MGNVRLYMYTKKAEKKLERVYFSDVRFSFSPRSSNLCVVEQRKSISTITRLSSMKVRQIIIVSRVVSVSDLSVDKYEKNVMFEIN